MLSLPKLPWAIMLWTWSITGGPALTPIISGFSAPVEGWRWSLWEIRWAVGPVFVVMLVFLPESSHNAILLRRAKLLRKVVDISSLTSESEETQEAMHWKHEAKEALIKPVNMIVLDPVVLYSHTPNRLDHGKADLHVLDEQEVVLVIKVSNVNRAAIDGSFKINVSELDSSSCALRAIGLRKLSKTPASPLQPDTPILSIVSENSKPPFKLKQLGHAIAFEPSPQVPSFPETPPFEHKNVNFGLIKKWMDDCVAEHPQCKSGTRSSTHTLEVIDCKKTKDENPDKPKLANLPTDGIYAALSYVWGDVEDDFPQVVEDSITVALQLDCGYLWVDRHCIPQKDKDPKKQELLQMMGDIYSQARFTIVAAAGQDCNYGLVGVTRPRKSEPRYAHVPGARLTYLGTPPAEKIRSTLWASRGWTYQEGFLSHRRIFFTDEQVMFQCNTMTYLESFERPMSVLHKHNEPEGRKNPYLVDIEPISLARRDIGKHMEEFSNRNLTKDSDTLRAFSGILSYFWDEGFFHLHGNPIPVKKEKGHLINAWYHTKPGARNSNFPSWSWTGWKGETKPTTRDYPDYNLRLFESKTTSREDLDDELRSFDPEHSISLDDYKRECRISPLPKMEPVIELRGMMAKMSFRLIKWDSETVDPGKGDDETTMQDGAWAILPRTGDITYYSFLYLDNEALTGICQFQLPVMVLQSGERSPERHIVILVLREKGGRYERVGMVILWRKNREAKAKLTMQRDKRSVKWEEPASIPELQEFTWWGKLKRESILLQ
ncbi:unnamed protein product [Fusarium equiseti]|uniref:Heterokaryon incompatibility domain-containing protein n=1 Tax=Fusarium equiseti TaxID=61235 RepID=A0A8J2NM94_FUSEQ|nr:unnamed protein product [Fusarium equiseti]